jgi:membrane protease YdiL (CAAX protease family)
VGDVLPLLPLFLFAVMTVAYLSSVALGALGIAQAGGGVAGLGCVPDFFVNCLVPALLEELFFRGLILSLLWQRMGMGGVWLSAIVFALAHGSLYQLPYAFVGGVFLALVVTLGGSVWLSFAFHLINNFLSFLPVYTPQAWGWISATTVLYAAIALTALASVVYLNAKKKAPAALALASLFDGARENGGAVFRAAVCSPLATYVILMLTLTIVRALP